MDRKVSQHIVNHLIYAIDSEGKIVGVDDVLSGVNCACFCPACKEPLIAKNQGTKRIHHFAHQSGTECVHAFESMLHILAKEKLRTAFFSKHEFCIEFEYDSYCSSFKECGFHRCDYNYEECCNSETKRFDLKEYYDSCEQEKAYDDINRRSDLKIFSRTNPKRTPIYLEFCVTHASDSEKLHSGNKIIEIELVSEEDIMRLIQRGIVEGNYGINCRVNFYGFKNEDFNNKDISNYIGFVRCILYKSGKSHACYEYCDCKELSKSKPNSLLEICAHTSKGCFDINIKKEYDKFKYIGYKQFKIKNCVLCENYVDSYNNTGKLCRLYKRLQIPKENLDTAKAKDCPCFKFNEGEMDSVLGNSLSENYTIYK